MTMTVMIIKSNWGITPLIAISTTPNQSRRRLFIDIITPDQSRRRPLVAISTTPDRSRRMLGHMCFSCYRTYVMILCNWLIL